jgi:hypothetical protein
MSKKKPKTMTVYTLSPGPYQASSLYHDGLPSLLASIGELAGWMEDGATIEITIGRETMTVAAYNKLPEDD